MAELWNIQINILIERLDSTTQHEFSDDREVVIEADISQVRIALDEAAEGFNIIVVLQEQFSSIKL